MTFANVIDFNSHKARRADQGDQRSHGRYPSDDRLFVQVVVCLEDPELVGTTLSSTASDVSTGGVQLTVSSSVPAGTLLDLWVDVRARPGKFFLSGEVRWSQQNADGSWNVGVELKRGAATDIDEWESFHTQASVS